MTDAILWADAWRNVDFDEWPIGEIYMVHDGSTFTFGVSNECPITLITAHMVCIDGDSLCAMSNETLGHYKIERL